MPFTAKPLTQSERRANNTRYFLLSSQLRVRGWLLSPRTQRPQRLIPAGAVLFVP